MSKEDVKANVTDPQAPNPVTIIGYTNEFSVQPGQDLHFMIDTGSSVYTANVVRLIGGMPDPDNSTFLPTEPVTADCAGEYPGRRQITAPGSYAELPLPGNWMQSGEFSAQLWIYPTVPVYDYIQTVWSARSADGTSGAALALETDGRLALSLTGGCGQSVTVRTDIPLKENIWYSVVLQYAASTQAAKLFVTSRDGWKADDGLQVHTAAANLDYSNVALARVLLAADSDPAAPGRTIHHYNGKIGNPRFWGELLPEELLSDVLLGTDGIGVVPLADYDFSVDIASTRLEDLSAGGYHGTLHQGGTRAVTSHSWTGEHLDYRHAPKQYAAVHFHDNDLVDAEWEIDISWKIPDDLPSGIYALKLEAEGSVDFIPFFVRPLQGTVSAPVLFLAPTNTYLAYGNERLFKFAKDYLGEDYVLPSQDVYLDEHPEVGNSIYDLHNDGSGVQFSSRLRPLLNIRPHYRNWRAVRHFSADLYITGWLEKRGQSYDVATDEDLHHEGVHLLSPYKVLITGSHPEYWTRPMMKALEQYLANGGRVMYLGGNGFYWVTSLEPDRPSLLEVRRGNAGSRASDSPPGELFHSTTGESGGLWRHHGYVPQRLVGVGTSALGGGSAAGYRRLDDSFKPEAGFIFEGIDENEIIGDFGHAAGGAAGDEIDRYDLSFGTPPHTLRLATSTGHDDNYQFVHEDQLHTAPGQGGTTNPLVRADMTYFDIHGGGAVFSVGSVNWAGSLGWNDYNNNVVRISDNVLSKLLL